MKILKTLDDLRQFQNFVKAEANASLGFVPTMGALHQGHLSLLNRAVKENSFAALSIYVNPTQFNQVSDFEKYPSTLEQDLAMAKNAGISAVFLPNYDLIYPDQYQFRIVAPELTNILCGRFRPGHFDGVLTVVNKLFQLVQPAHSYFGEKDYQQLVLIKKMTEAFYLPTKIIPVPTVRESSGLAMSSRNVRLSAEGKKQAALIYKALNDSKTLTETRDLLEKNHFEVEYVEEHFGRRFTAAWLEGVRLIDNIPLGNMGSI